MKKFLNKKTLIIALAVIIVAVVTALALPPILRSAKVNELISEQNYVAAKLLELGDYNGGRLLAMQTEQLKPNKASKQITALSYGFEADLDTAISYSDELLKVDSGDKILKKFNELSTEMVKLGEEMGYSSYGGVYYLDENTRAEYMKLLSEVIDSIKLKRSISAMQSLLETYSSGINPGVLETLKDDKSLFAQSVRTAYLAERGDYESAYEAAKELFAKNDSFENRAMLANITAKSAVFATDTDPEPIKRALNFIETTTPLSERSNPEYNLERAYLYHLLGEDEKTNKVLMELLSENNPERPVGLLLDKISSAHSVGSSQNQNNHLIMQSIWNIFSLLHITDSYTDYEQSFEKRITDFFDTYYNGIIIREIDSKDFPKIKVRLNIATDYDGKLKKGDFKLNDMDVDIGSFKLTPPSRALRHEETTIMLVVDNSGSMQGQPIEDTKVAVKNFVNGLDSTVKTGLVVFDNYAQLVTEPDTRRTQLISEVSALGGNGGTNIYSGLEVAYESLRSISGRKIVILLSDGGDGNRDIIDNVLDKLSLDGISVYTIGFGGADSAYLEYIAESCGGKYLYADSSKLLSSIYGEIGSSMDNEYILEFTAKGSLEEFDRELKVMVSKIFTSADRDYYVGVKPSLIERDASSPAEFDCFRQYGGSLLN